MPVTLSTADRIHQLRAEIARLQTEAAKELRQKREALAAELAQVDALIAQLSGESGSANGRVLKVPAKSLSLQELKEWLEKAPDKTLSIRKEKLDLRNIKVLAEANPRLLKLGGNGPWPTVTLLK
jgi:hypothetical protein